MLGHFLHDVHDGQLVSVFNNAFIQRTNHILNDPKLVEQLPASVEHLMTEDVFFTIDPQVGETFLGRIKNFCEVAKGTLFVQYFVGFAELVAVVPRLAICFENFAKPFDLVQEAFACPLAIV